MEEDRKLSTKPTGWNVAVVDAPVVCIPSRAEFDALQRLVETLSMRLHVQTETINTLTRRLDQVLGQNTRRDDSA